MAASRVSHGAPCTQLQFVAAKGCSVQAASEVQHALLHPNVVGCNAASFTCANAHAATPTVTHLHPLVAMSAPPPQCWSGPPPQRRWMAYLQSAAQWGVACVSRGAPSMQLPLLSARAAPHRQHQRYSLPGTSQCSKPQRLQLPLGQRTRGHPHSHAPAAPCGDERPASSALVVPSRPTSLDGEPAVDSIVGGSMRQSWCA